MVGHLVTWINSQIKRKYNLILIEDAVHAFLES